MTGTRPDAGAVPSVVAPRNLGQRQTRQRLIVFDALARLGGFTGAQALYLVLRKDGHRIGLNTVYRNLRRLADTGWLDLFRDENGEQLFRVREAPGHSHYLVCRSCGRSDRVAADNIEAWSEQTARAHEFTQVRHVVELTGLCPQCSRGSALREHTDRAGSGRAAP